MLKKTELDLSRIIGSIDLRSVLPAPIAIKQTIKNAKKKRGFLYIFVFSPPP
jgi:hypothetical protein